MKTIPSNNLGGATLIEMLSAIAIIAILASMALSACVKALNRISRCHVRFEQVYNYRIKVAADYEVKDSVLMFHMTNQNYLSTFGINAKTNDNRNH